MVLLKGSWKKKRPKDQNKTQGVCVCIGMCRHFSFYLFPFRFFFLFKFGLISWFFLQNNVFFFS